MQQSKRAHGENMTKNHKLSTESASSVLFAGHRASSRGASLLLRAYLSACVSTRGNIVSAACPPRNERYRQLGDQL